MKPSDALLRIHDFLPASRANGPGERAVVWMQGCTLACPGCFNPATHAAHDGKLVSVDQLFEQIAALGDQIEGVTISGGEPLQQISAVETLLRKLRRETNLSTLVFTGFTWLEIQKMPSAARLLESVDVMLAGRYEQNNRVATGLLGSSNKTIHFLTSRYAFSDLENIPEAEVILTAAGEVIYSGINPLTGAPPAGIA